MTQIYLIPNWFFGYDIALEIIFGIITLIIARYALKIHSMTKQREAKLMGISFCLISLSYFIWSFINLILVEELNATTKVLYLREINLLNVVLIYSHLFIFMAGLATLFYMTSKVKSGKIYAALILVSTIGIFLSFNKIFALTIIAAVFLGFIIIFYLNEYMKNKNLKQLFILLAYIFLFIANLESMVLEKTYQNYVISHILTLFSFLLLIISLIMILKHGQKKNKA